MRPSIRSDRRVKVLTVACTPRKRSSTEPSTTARPSSIRAGSKVTRTSTPLTVTPRMRAIAGRVATPAMASIICATWRSSPGSWSRRMPLSAAAPSWVSERWLSARCEVSRQARPPPVSARRGAVTGSRHEAWATFSTAETRASRGWPPPKGSASGSWPLVASTSTAATVSRARARAPRPSTKAIETSPSGSPGAEGWRRSWWKTPLAPRSVRRWK